MTALTKSPFYVWPRSSNQQLDLSGVWQLTHLDQPADPHNDVDLQALAAVNWVDVHTPGMIQGQWYKAGQSEHPYEGMNSKSTIWMEERAWWYRKTFCLPADWAPADRYELVFDGIDHDARIWLDGVELGEHVGAFGGPVYVITSALLANPASQHELLVRMIPAGNGRGNPTNNQAGRLIKAQTFTRWVNNPDILTCGIWRPVRLVATRNQRLERPFCHVLECSPEAARLSLEVEVLAAETNPTERFIFRNGNRGYPFIHDDLYNTEVPQPPTEVLLELLDARGGVVYSEIKTLLPKCGREWLTFDFSIHRPQLWHPVGLGEPYLYQCRLTLRSDRKAIDQLVLPVGIRSVQWVKSAARKVQDAWFNWQCRINGQDVFLKGINWKPIDLLDFPASKYRWYLLAARAAGIQFLRVWGGGNLESDAFYRICDELGIMVWQDFPINSSWTCPDLPLEPWEAQVMWNIFRLRSHPALVLWCGGNEFDPYHPQNAGIVGIMERNLERLDGSRPFVRACCDPGDVHPYPTCDTTWYWQIWQGVPAISEWGSHTLPCVPSLKELLLPEERELRLGDLTSLNEEAFTRNHPSLRNHWAEFGISRVPGTISRASILADLTDPTLDELVEAVQIGAGEVYSTVIRSFRSGYPATTLLMPWVYNRPWPSVGMQLIDHSGRLTAGYYAVRQAYRPDQAVLIYPYEVLAPGEIMPVQVFAIHDAPSALPQASLEVSVLSCDLRVLVQHHWSVDMTGGPIPLDVGSFDLHLPDGVDTAVFLKAEMINSVGTVLSRSIYWLRTTDELVDADRRAAYRAKAQPSLLNKLSGRVRPLSAKSPTQVEMCVMTSTLVDLQELGGGRQVMVTVNNVGTAPALFTHFVWENPAWLLLAEDNYFWLEPGEKRGLTLTFAPTGGASSWDYSAEWSSEFLKGLAVKAWNSL